MTPAAPSQRGFTLVELLVVSGLFLVFFSMTVAAMRPNRDTQVRELSQQLSSALLTLQTKSLHSESGSALILDPAMNDPALAAVSGTGCGACFLGQMPPFIRGTATGLPEPSSATSATGSFTPVTAGVSDLADGYQVRFTDDASGAVLTPWLSFSSSGSNTCTVTFKTGLSQTANNTLWPVTAAPPGFIVARRPLRGQAAFSPPKLAAIDLRYSGVGDRRTASFGSLVGLGAVSICFNRQGRFETIIQSASPNASLHPSAPLYLLLATEADIRADTALQSQVSRWLAISPGSGRITVARNLVVSGRTEADVNAARANARTAITEGAR